MGRQPVAEEVLCRWLDKANITQTALGEALDVSRAAVSKWCLGRMVPSVDRARVLEEISKGAVPADIWPRRPAAEPATRGARVLQATAKKMGLSISQLSRHTGIPQRALHRWMVGQHAPRKPGLALLNSALRLSLKESDFEVAA